MLWHRRVGSARASLLGPSRIRRCATHWPSLSRRRPCWRSSGLDAAALAPARRRRLLCSVRAAARLLVQSRALKRPRLGSRIIAVLPYATFEGDRVTLHNIRNFDYRSETDYTPAYYDRTFNLNELDSVDLAAVYWMGPAIAHVFVQLRLRRRPSRGDLDRGAQGEGRGIFHGAGILPPVRTLLRRSRTSATSSACAPTTVTIRPRRSISTACRHRR